MSSSAFDGTPARREDVSMKLRVQRMKNVSEQTKLLEEESRKMEERLQELKLAMGREKEEREKQGGGFWKTGQQGILTKHAQVVLNNSGDSAKAKDSKPRKIKLIKDEPTTSAAAAGVSAAKAPAVPGTMAFLLQKESSKPSSGTQQRGSATSDRNVSSASKGGLQCGQCEQKTAVVSCFECSEQYCAHCFASFHLRGALKKHRSVPLIGSAAAAGAAPQSPANHGTVAVPAAPGSPAPVDRTGSGSSIQRWAIPVAQQSAANDDKRKEGGNNSSKMQIAVAASQSSLKIERRSSEAVALSQPASLKTAARTAAVDTAPHTSSLLEGTFSEAESAQSFQDALKQWRTSGSVSSATTAAAKLDSKRSSATSTTATTGKPGVRFSAMDTFRTASPSCVDEGTSTASLKLAVYEPEFQTSGGITYADRLLLKTHRRTELGTLPDGHSGRSSRDNNSSSSSSTRAANGVAPAESQNGQHRLYGSDQEADDVIGPEQGIDFMQLRDLVTPSYQEDSTNWQNAAIVAFEIAEADDLTNDANVEQYTARYKVIEDGEVLEESAILMTPKIDERKSSNRDRSKEKKNETVSPHFPSGYQSRTPILTTASNNIAPAVRSSSMKPKLPAKAAAKDAAATSIDSTTSEGPKGKVESTTQPILHTQSKAGVGGVTVADSSAGHMPMSARSERGAQSQASNRARPYSRARSMAERAAELKKGGLSLEATESLKAISRRSSQDIVTHPDRGTHIDVLGDFFCLWLPQEPVERTLTPTSRKLAKDVDGSATAMDIQRHHISNKVYQTSPQVWRPQSSLADIVTEEEAIRCVSAVPAELLDRPAALSNDARTAFGDLETQPDEARDLVPSNATPSTRNHNLHSGADNASPMQTASTTMRSSWDVRHSSSTAKNDGPSWVQHDSAFVDDDALPQLKRTETPRALQGHQSRNRTSNDFSMRSSHPVGDNMNSHKRDASRLSLQRATSKDSLTSYDMLGERTPRSSDGSDELRTLDELERELASQTGRLTADGITSCLPDSLDAEERREETSSGDDDEERTTQQAKPDELNNDLKKSWDLRESMMHDFDDMEQAFADESSDL